MTAWETFVNGMPCFYDSCSLSRCVDSTPVAVNNQLHACHYHLIPLNMFLTFLWMNRTDDGDGDDGDDDGDSDDDGDDDGDSDDDGGDGDDDGGDGDDDDDDGSKSVTSNF